jgi:hypothetical protein
MAFFAALIAYVGTAAGVTVALLMALGAFISAPAVPANPRQAVVVAQKTTHAKSVQAAQAATTPPASPTSLVSATIHPRVTPVPTAGRTVLRDRRAADARKAAVANSASRRQYSRWVDRHEHARQWAYQLTPSFQSRYMGYVDAPLADSSRLE